MERFRIPRILWKTPKLGFALALLMAASMYFYVQEILIPYQKADAVVHGRPRGNLSDLYPRWLGARELLLYDHDPYSAEVTRDIQAGYYGRPLIPGRPGEPKDEVRFAYPVYVVFLLSPTIRLPFTDVQIAFSSILGILTALSLLLWLYAVRWQPSPGVLAIFLVLTVGSFATIQGIKRQQLSLLVAALIAGGTALLGAGQLILGGIVLALATIKPQLVALLAVWLVIWTLGDWRKRQAWFWGFLLTGGVLAGAGEYVLPGWLKEFVQGLAAYNRYTGGHSLLDVLAPGGAGVVLTVLFLLGTTAVCWRLRRAEIDSPAFCVAVALVLTVTVVVAPMVAPYNQVLLLPAILLILRSWKELWRRNAFNRAACVFAAVIVFWPWLASLALTFALIVLPARSVQRAWAVPLWSSLGIPLVVLGLLAFVVRDTMRQNRLSPASAQR
jgi:Glycosyltransferase family 87